MPSLIQINLECDQRLTPVGAHALSYELLRGAPGDPHDSGGVAGFPRWRQRGSELEVQVGCADELAQHMLWTLSGSGVVRVGQHRANLMRAWRVEQSGNPVENADQLHLEFAAPTSFKRAGHYLPLPLPELILASAQGNWNQLSGVVGVKPQVSSEVYLARASVRTTEVRLSAARNMRVRAFEGDVTLEAGSPDGARALGLLEEQLRYVNIGVKAGYGLGWVITHRG